MRHMIKLTASVIAACATFSSPISADQIAEDAVNSSFAEYTVLENYPGCDLPGQTAYQIAFEAEDIGFVVQNQWQGGSRTIGAEPSLAPRQCYRRERRGVELVQIPIDCDDSSPLVDPFALTDLDNTSFSMSADATMCLSLSGFTVLDGSWTAQIISGFERTEHSGTFLKPAVESCSDPVRASGMFGTLDFVTSGMWGHPGVRRHWRRSTVYENPPAPAIFQLKLFGIPFASSNADETGFVAGTRAFFFPAFEGQANCPEGICYVPRLVNGVSPGSAPDICE